MSSFKFSVNGNAPAYRRFCVSLISCPLSSCTLVYAGVERVLLRILLLFDIIPEILDILSEINDETNDARRYKIQIMHGNVACMYSFASKVA